MVLSTLSVRAGNVCTGRHPQSVLRARWPGRESYRPASAAVEPLAETTVNCDLCRRVALALPFMI